MTATHTLTPDITLFHADCREALKALPDNCIDSVPTDPPYALVSIVKRFGSPNAAPAKGNDAYMRASAGFMGKTWDTGETAMSVEFWREVLRVLKPGGHVAAFGSSRGYHRMACAIEDAGFEIRDSLMWVYGTGFPKSHDVSKGINAKLVAGSARTEDMRRLAMGDDYEPSGRGRANYDHGGGSVMNGETGDVMLVPEAQAWTGWGTALKPAFEPIVLARKPLSEPTVAANVLRWGTGALNIDACRVETDEDRRRNARGGENGLAGTSTYKIRERRAEDQPETSGRWPANVVHDGSDEVVGAFPSQAHRFFYSAKASKADRAGSKHPTVKRVDLMQWLSRLITPPGGVILDPFAGSGTTGAAAQLEGFRAILCEREDEYVRDILRRFDCLVEPESRASEAYLA